MESLPNLFNGCVQLVEKPFILLILIATCVNHPEHAQGKVLKELFNVMLCFIKIEKINNITHK